MSPRRIIRTRALYTLAATGLSASILLACGGEAPPEANEEPPITMQPAPVTLPVADAGRNLRVVSNELAQLDAGLSQPAQGNDAALIYQWRQISGPALRFVDESEVNSATARFIAPAVSTPAEVEVELILSQGEQSARDRLVIQVEPCSQAEDVIFGDCLAAPFGPFTAYESSTAFGELHQVLGVGDYHLNWQRVDTGDVDHGEVLEITWMGHDGQAANRANGWFGIASDDAGADSADLTAYAEGAIRFDMRVVYQEAPNSPTPFLFKMECGWPCSSGEMAMPGAESSYEWQTYTFSVAELAASGLQLNNVTYAFVIQPLWQQQQQRVTVQIDNVRLTKDYAPPPTAEGCPAAGNIQYNLARASNPTADQLDAYQRITQAMDEAVEQYNCYTNLQRSLNVSYNPSIATADGNFNGSIRFGSRASMHPVTAMHEISHALGIGTTSNFRDLVRDGVYTGAAGTAQLRAISGKPEDQIRSDGTHFWPHGLNYISEGGTPEDLINHCLMVEAIISDLNL